MGTNYVVMMVATLCLIIIVFSYPVKNVKIISRVRNYLIDFFCWNFLLRLFIETSMELTFSLLLNKDFIYLPASGFFESLDYVFSILMAVLLFGMATLSVHFYSYNKEKLDDEDFKKWYGDFYDGLKSHTIASLNYNRLFILRRIVIAINSYYFLHSLWL